jgi:hypothetical protein
LRILITGSRNWTAKGVIEAAIWKYTLVAPVLILGGARGADALAAQIAEEHGWATDVFWADWRNHGKAAGPIRNQRMLDHGHPDIVLAFPLPDSVGTWDMVERAKRAGVPVEVF